jgi:hypothetical protein
MLEQINEPIEVIVKFALLRQGSHLRQGFGGQARNKTIPVKFFWNGREILIKKINLVWSSFEGRVKFYFFAVSDDANYFKLQFNTDNLSWTLLEVYAE